jgi:hypothetical protein
MKLSKDLIAKSAIAISAFSALATTAFAVSDYSYSYDTTGDPAAAAVLGSLGIFGIIIPLCCGLIGLVLYAFNIWMIIDVLKRTEVELPNKTTWMVLLIVGFLMGFGPFVALFYYFGPRKKLAVK